MSSSTVAYQAPDFIKAPVLSTEAAHVSHELENELLEIRERLRLTESQLVEERNARNATNQKVSPASRNLYLACRNLNRYCFRSYFA